MYDPESAKIQFYRRMEELTAAKFTTDDPNFFTKSPQTRKSNMVAAVDNSNSQEKKAVHIGSTTKNSKTNSAERDHKTKRH